jgi:capsular exopolysaccharide synthesis family protein
MSTKASVSTPSFGAGLIPSLVEYVKYWKLMVFLLLIGCLSGVVYFVYSPSVYQSRSLVDLKIFALPIATDSLDTRRLHRSLLDQLNSRQMIASAAHRLGIADKNASFEHLRMKKLKKVSVSMLDWSTLQIDVYSESPDIVREFPKALVDHFETYQREQRMAFMDVAVQKYRDELNSLRAKIDGQLKENATFAKDNMVAEAIIEQNSLAHVPVDLLQTQMRLQKFEDAFSILKARRGNMSPQEELSLLESVKKLAVNSNPLGEIISPTGDINDRLAAPGAALGGAPQTIVVQPAMVEGLRPWHGLERDLRLVEQEAASASRTFLSDHPKMIAFTNRIKQLNEQMDAELHVERQRFEVEHQQLKEEVRQLEKKMPEYTASTEKLNRIRSDYTLTREGDIAWSKAYTDLSQKLTSMQFGADKDRVDMQFKAYSLLRDEDPVSPTKSKLAMLALVIGVGLAVGVPFGLEQIDERVKSMETLESGFALKGLGLIPSAHKSFIENILREPHSDSSQRPNHILECYRVLRAHVMMEMGSGQLGGKVILFTSARPGEGKSLTSGNLGWAFQSMGARVILLDMDFRRGRVHKFFDADAGPGLCQVLTGEQPLESVIRESSLPGLSYISRGTTCSDSSELLCRLGVDDILATLRDSYDWIILDSPPVLGLSETTLIQKAADGVVMVIRAEKTLMSEVKNTLTLLRKSDSKLIGFVYNGVELNKVANYYNYYQYSQHYYEHVISGQSSQLA